MKLLDYLQVLHPTDKISNPKIYDGQLYYYRFNNRLVEAKLCVEPKKYPISEFEISIETRNDRIPNTIVFVPTIYIYIFHKNFIYDYFDDTVHLYEIDNKKFYDEFEYVFEKNNLFSLNEYTPKHMNTEQECIEFLTKIGFKIMD